MAMDREKDGDDGGECYYRPTSIKKETTEGKASGWLRECIIKFNAAHAVTCWPIANRY